MTRNLRRLSLPEARRLWLHAQRLDTPAPFGEGPGATRLAIAHLGYVQIDTINVIERSHHHILYTRIPAYRRDDLHRAQAVDRTVFEYWTHALAYVAVSDFPFFVRDMKAHRISPVRWYADVPEADVQRLVRRIRRDGAISIRDVDDDVRVERDHPWASRKPTKRVLQRGFFDGRLAISERAGMVKTYEILERHFGWPRLPPAPSAAAQRDYPLERALRAQGLVSGPSVMHPLLRFPPDLAAAIARRVQRKDLHEVRVEDDPTPFYATPQALDDDLPELDPDRVHILSPFDPLVIQRRRLQQFFGYEHVFEAYVPKARRRFGYFTLPVLVGDRFVAALDLKADRAARRLLVQAWHWLDGAGSPRLKRLIEAELDRFAVFQLARDDPTK